jgi:hypothetical protein
MEELEMLFKNLKSQKRIIGYNILSTFYSLLLSIFSCSKSFLELLLILLDSLEIIGMKCLKKLRRNVIYVD